MQRHRLLLAGAAAALVACVARQPDVMTDVAVGDLDVLRWTATLAPPPAAPGDTIAQQHAAMHGNVTGTAAVTSGSSTTETRATVTLNGAAPGATHPWHVHLGRCDDDRGIVGQATAYTPITVGQDGRGTATVTLPFTAPTEGEYFVKVHHSPSTMGAIVACGNLTGGVR